MYKPLPVGERVTAVLAGELDHYTAPDVRAQLDQILQDPRIMHMTLDLSNLSFMDSSGIGVMLGRLRLLQSRGGTLSVCRLQPPVRKLFELTGMHRVIAVLDDLIGG